VGKALLFWFRWATLLPLSFRVYPNLVARNFVRGNRLKLVVTGFFLVALLGAASAGARSVSNWSETGGVTLSTLPVQGQETYSLIYQGGPFPFDKDGTVFGNRERQLPMRKRGYYREYTVRTPGARDRGAKRIVCGGPATTPDVCFYSADHYANFRQIVP
jgi:ribonuclease T1